MGYNSARIEQAENTFPTDQQKITIFKNMAV